MLFICILFFFYSSLLSPYTPQPPFYFLKIRIKCILLNDGGLVFGISFFFFFKGCQIYCFLKILLVFIFLLPSVRLNFLRLFMVSVFPSIHFLAFGSPFLTQQVRPSKIWPQCNLTFPTVNTLPMPSEVFRLLGL